MLKRPEIPLFVVALAVLAAVLVLALTGHAIPTTLYVALSGALGGGLGVTVPASTSSAGGAVPPLTAADFEQIAENAFTSLLTGLAQRAAAPAAGAPQPGTPEPAPTAVVPS